MAGSALAAEEATAVVAAEPSIRTYYLAFVRDNPDFVEEEWIDDAMADHRVDRANTAGDQYLRSLIVGEVALLAGPLEDGGPIRQLAVLDVATPQEAAFVFENSPGIQTGRMKVEILAWRAPEGILKRAKDPANLRDAYVGFLKRPVQVPEHTREQLEELERGHLENLRRMTETGELVLAGPVENGGELRGLMIFRGQDEERIRELVGADPAVRARRLEVELHRWRIPKRSWPPKTDVQMEARRAEP
jgi:uncharacterized protein YciI